MLKKYSVQAFFVFLLLAYTPIFADKKPSNPKKYVNNGVSEFLISYPRSGSHLTCYFLEMIMNKEIVLGGGKTPRSLKYPGYGTKRFSSSSFNKDVPPICKTHAVKPLHLKLNCSQNKLLLILRNYKECIPRRMKEAENDYNIDLLKKSILDLDDSRVKIYRLNNKSGFDLYLEGLIFYDNWEDESTKLLVHYEDLISNPIETLKKVFFFLDDKFEIPDDLERTINGFLKDSLNRYKKKFGPKHSSDGKDEIFHSKDYPLEDLR